MKEKNKDGIKRINFFLWLAAGAVVFVGVFLYCRDWFRADGERNLFHYYGQENMVVSDGWLYYCDVLRKNALCRYHPEAKQIQTIEEAEGVLKKTGTGVYYIVGNVVYRIEDTQLTEVQRIPAERFSFVDCYKDTVYWIEREKEPEEKDDIYDLEYVYAQTCSGEAEPKLLFHQTEEDIRDVVIARACLYLMTSKGIYRTEPGKDEWEKITENSGLKFYGDDTCVIIKTKKDSEGEGWYEVTPEGQLKRQTAHYGLTVALHEGEIFYPSGGRLYKENLGKEGEEEVLFTELPDYPWDVMEVYEGGIFLRGYLCYDIWNYDFATNTFACIIKQNR